MHENRETSGAPRSFQIPTVDRFPAGEQLGSGCRIECIQHPVSSVPAARISRAALLSVLDRLSSAVERFKRVGLHYIPFSKYCDCKDETCACSTVKIRQFRRLRDELRLELHLLAAPRLYRNIVGK